MCINGLFTSCTLYFVRDDKNKDVQSAFYILEPVIIYILSRLFNFYVFKLLNLNPFYPTDHTVTFSRLGYCYLTRTS